MKSHELFVSHHKNRSSQRLNLQKLPFPRFHHFYNHPSIVTIYFVHFTNTEIYKKKFRDGNPSLRILRIVLRQAWAPEEAFTRIGRIYRKTFVAMMRLIVLFFSLTNLWVNAHSQQVVSVGFDREQEVNVDRSGIIINITPNAATPSNPFEYLLKAFLQVTVVVKGADDKVLPSYGVKGISTDDAHEVIETLIFNALKFEKPTKSKENFLRDILSSCPNPFSKIRNKCTLKFSPFGEAAVSVYPKSKVALKILVTSTFSPTLLLTLLIGIALLAMANEMSKSKIFQVSHCTLLF